MVKMVARGYTATADAYLTPCIMRYGPQPTVLATTTWAVIAGVNICYLQKSAVTASSHAKLIQGARFRKLQWPEARVTLVLIFELSSAAQWFETQTCVKQLSVIAAGTSRHFSPASMTVWTKCSCPSCSLMEASRRYPHSLATRPSCLGLLEGKLADPACCADLQSSAPGTSRSWPQRLAQCPMWGMNAAGTWALP